MREWLTATVEELQAAGVLLVEDGNHGEYRPRPTEFTETGVSYVRAADMRDGVVDFGQASKIGAIARARIRKGIGRDEDVLLSHKGTVGRVAFVPTGSPEFVCSPQTTFWRSLARDQIEPRYLQYYLQSPSFVRRLASRSGETDMAPYVSLTEQRRLPVLLPPIHEQRGIGATLGALDDKIESNSRLTEVAMKVARSYVDAAVVDHQQVRYGMAVEVRMGSAFKGDAFSKPGVGRPLLRIRDLKTFESQTWTTESRRDETVISPGDIVVGMDAEFRATLWLGQDSVLNQRVCSFVGRPGVGRAFILAVLEPELAAEEAAKTGTTVIHLNKADIDKFEVPDLTTDEHYRLSELTEPLIDLVVARGFENQSLANTRDVLMSELFSGRIRVPEAKDAHGLG